MSIFAVAMSRKIKSKYRYNPETMVYEKQQLTFFEKYTRPFLMLVSVLLMTWFVVFLLLSVFKLELPKTVILRNRNAEWISKMEILENRLNGYEEVLAGIEDRDNSVYRSILGLGDISNNVRCLYENVGNSRIDESNYRIENMSRRAYMQSKSLDDVAKEARNVGDLVAHIPSVPPLRPGADVRLSSSFGYRRDPVYGGHEYHQGQDFATRKGTAVYATGDGVVVMTSHKFSGYGNEVMVDHGFGYKTRYAHLSLISVAEGLEVKRGDKIGEVGSSGKSTGPHLHYEVLFRDKRVNPYNFMDFSMDAGEFKAMVDKRKKEKEGNNKLTASDIVNRRKH